MGRAYIHTYLSGIFSDSKTACACLLCWPRYLQGNGCEGAVYVVIGRGGGGG